ncbi:hypothetical protein APHAL10511_004222 [Amanita phalloides]|nr:hypothetical protein APHAL10511_004222 [Amanita phalloides]
MATNSPTPKKWASRIMKRASTVLAPARPETPDKERSSVDLEREDGAADSGSIIKRIGRSRSSTSLSAIQTRPSSPAAQAQAITQPVQQPSPISESPSREAAASQEESGPPPAAAKSPLSQEVKPTNTESQPLAQLTQQQQPLSAAAGPGAFLDDVDDLPSSDPIPDPFAPAARPTETSGGPVEGEGAPQDPEHASSQLEALPTQRQLQQPPAERAPSEGTQPTEPSLIPTAHNSSELLVARGDEDGQQDGSAPIPIPQHRGTFFEHLKSSPEEEGIVPPPQMEGPHIQISAPVPPHEEQAPTTPPSRQAYLDTYVSEQEGWTGPSERSVGRRDIAHSLNSSTSSSENVPASRSLENPFGDPVAPRLAPQHGNGYLPSSSDQNHASMSMPVALIPGNSKSNSGHQTQFLSTPKAYGNESDSDESQPLIRKAQKTGNPSYTFNPTAPLAGRYTFEQHEASTPPRLRENGWVEIHLPDSYVYYVNPSAHIVADFELRNERLFQSIMDHLELEQHKDAMESASEGSELWVRDVGNPKRGFIPVRWWVNHKERSVVFDKAFDVAVKRKLLKKKKEDEDQLDLEYRYWAFVEAHPSHVILQTRAKQEAYEAINWAMTERLLPSQSPIPAPFSQEECGTLLDLLNRFDDDKNRQVDTAIQTRTIARILLRVAQWRQQHFRPNKPLPKDVTAQTAKAPSYRRPFPRVLLDFTISLLCLGIPYFFLDRSREHRADEESGLRTAAPMFVIGACTCIMASIVLSATVTFLTLSGLDSIMRIAGFVALISAVFSMASTLLAIFTIKADLERPPQVIGGEGLLMLSRRNVVMSLPVVFLLYSIVGFVTGVVLFSLRGASITDVNLIRRPFSEYTRWTAAGALGAIAGMATMSAILLFKR